MRDSAEYVISVVKAWERWGNWNEAQRAILEDIIYYLGQAERVEELEQQNKRYRETMESSVSEIKYALYSNKSKDVKEHYLKNAERYITEALEDER